VTLLRPAPPHIKDSLLFNVHSILSIDFGHQIAILFSERSYRSTNHMPFLWWSIFDLSEKLGSLNAIFGSGCLFLYFLKVSLRVLHKLRVLYFLRKFVELLLDLVQNCNFLVFRQLKYDLSFYLYFGRFDYFKESWLLPFFNRF
jgi:hypothetical protein